MIAYEAPPGAPRLRDLDADVTAMLLDLYRHLGGRREDPDLRPGSWDLSANGVLIELDEELHFNRYRETTLRQTWAQSLPWNRPYLEFCQSRESECLRAATWGKRWTSESSANMFGDAAPPGDLLSAAGSPRWKQRALYDAIKDAVAAHGAGTKVARLSVYDEVSGQSLGNVLTGSARCQIEDLLALVDARTAQAPP
ncbi:hypothetical protein [Terrabacter sp. Soil810]|uniref:DUF7255 family protein n=1 Tax=Terrabacter sp. Soil810 TaxID=1736418 RepID=UPI0019109349|nr:hypothetical protein [Terrabacter sp. Soil810]